MSYQADSEQAQLLIPQQPPVAKKSGWDVVRDLILYVGVATVVVGTALAAVMGVNAVKGSIGSRAASSSAPTVGIMKSGRWYNLYASRTAPVAMSSYLSQKGFLPVFFEKYGFTFDKSQPLATEAVTKLDMGVKGDPTYWVTSTLYTGSTCDGDVVSVGGFAGNTCLPVVLTSGSQAVTFSCSSSNQVPSPNPCRLLPYTVVISSS